MDQDLERRLGELRDSDDVVALIELGCDLSDAGRSSDAEACFRRAARSGDPVAFYDLGNELAAQERWAETVEPYERAIAGGETDALFNLGLALEELGDLAGARRAYEAAAAAGDTKGWVHLAWLLRSLGELRPAAAAVEAGAAAGDLLAAAVHACWRWCETRDPALEADLWAGADRYDCARTDLADLLHGSGRLDEARKVLQRGVELGESASMLALGNLLSEELDDDVAAERVYRLGIAAGDAHCHDNLGVLLRERGDLDGAAEQFFYGELRGDALAARHLRELGEAFGS